MGPHQAGGNRVIIVTRAPPPAEVECVPPQPREECVWVDGSWRYAGRRWEWLPGAWLIPPTNCYYAEAYARWLPGGASTRRAPSPRASTDGASADSAAKDEDNGDRLFYFPAAWYPDSPGQKCAEPKICLVATPAAEC
jgi:hypothetical protein